MVVDIIFTPKMNILVYFCFFIWTSSPTSTRISFVESKKMMGILQSARKTPRMMSGISGTSTHQSYYNCRWRKQPAFVDSNIRTFNLATPVHSMFVRRNIVRPTSRAFIENLRSSQDDHISETQRVDPSINSNQAASSMITRGLNPSQEEATLRPRYSITRVIAGPGAGKTKVLTCRIAHLLLSSENSDHSLSEGILAVTFTKKAAMEMERRLSDLLSSSTQVLFEAEERNNDEYQEDIVVSGNADSIDVSRQLMRHATVGTFHSVCSKILRKFGNELGNLPSVRECSTSETLQPVRYVDYEKGEQTSSEVLIQTLDGSFNILDQSDQLRLLKQVLTEHKIKLKSNDTMRRGKSDDIRPITVLNAISLLNTEDAVLRTPQKNPRKDTISDEVKEKMSRKVRQIAEEIRIPFQKAKYAQNSIDFDDLIFLTRELLLFHSEVREVLNRKWRHILVDEFQDTSHIQLDLVRLLTTNSLFVVGDGDQSIYSWRGASPESMTDFEAAFHNKQTGWDGLIDVDMHGSSLLEVKSVYLMENYRSTQNIVRAAQRIISSSKGNSSDAQDDIRRDMKPQRGMGPAPRVLACKDAKKESSFVVKSINEMIEKGDLTPSSTVAIIYRTNAQSRLLEEACVEHNLRYVVRGSSGTFYKRAEIQDSLSFLRIFYNGRDRSAWARAVKAPSRGIGETSLNEFFRYCDAIAEKYGAIEDSSTSIPSPLDVLFSLMNPNGDDMSTLVPAKDFLSTRSINRFTPFAMSLSALKEKMTSHSLQDFLLSVIDELNLNTHFDAISKTRDEYEDRLSNVMELVRAADRYKDDGPCIGTNDESESPLERFLDDVSLIADIEPQNDGEDSGDQRVIANLMTIHSSKGMEFDAVFLVGNEEGTFPTQKAIGQGEGSIELSEERRLCYVAMTRAKTHLILTWRREVSYFAGNTFQYKDADRSRFLNMLVNKADGKSRNAKRISATGQRLKTRASNDKNCLKFESPAGRRMIHTQATRDNERHSKSGWNREPMFQRSRTNGENIGRKSQNKPTSTTRMIENEPYTNHAVNKQLKASSSHKTRKSWDNWEPSHVKKPIQQVPSISIRQMEFSEMQNHRQRAAPLQQFGSVGGEPRTEFTRKTQRSANRQQRHNNSHMQKSVWKESSKIAKEHSFSSDAPPDIDSTLFYPVGSYVKHKFYGRGKVQTPPSSDEEFVEKMLVRVHFEDETGNWDLPMDSLTHTYD